MTRDTGWRAHRVHPDHAVTFVPNAAPSYQSRRIQMYSLHEALARERIRDAERVAREARQAAELRSAKRWRRLERMASSAHEHSR